MTMEMTRPCGKTEALRLLTMSERLSRQWSGLIEHFETKCVRRLDQFLRSRACRHHNTFKQSQLALVCTEERTLTPLQTGYKELHQQHRDR